MKRSFPPPAQEALCALIGALACGAACAPNNGVKPGAPELIEFTIVQAGPTATTVTPDTPLCTNPIVSGDACLPMGSSGGGDGGADTPPDVLCRDGANNLWCTCAADGTDPAMGAWSCAPFTNVMAVIAVFDRLLDTAPLDPGDAAGLSDVVTTSASPGAPTFELLTDYSSTGAPNGFIFNLFGPAFFGNFRANGPSLFSAPQPGFPSDATVTVTLDPTKVRAKDGTTPFTGAGLLQGGELIFTTAPFSASISAPAAPTPDNMMPPINATVAFTNFVDAAEAEAHIAVTAGGAALAVTIESADGGASYSVTPASGAWPAGATIVVTVDATTKNVLGQTIAAAVSETFTAP